MSVKEDRFNGSDRFAGLLAILLLALVILYFYTKDKEATPKQAEPQQQEQVEAEEEEQGWHKLYKNEDGNYECPF